MLVQLTLKNFKIFKEETLLDCIPGPIVLQGTGPHGRAEGYFPGD